MSDLLRLKEDATDFERSLLESAGDDVPSPQAKQQTLAIMGLVGAGGAVASAATIFRDASGGVHDVLGANLSVGTAGATGGGVSMAAGKVATFALLKWLLGGAFTVVLAVGTWRWTSTANHVESPRVEKATHSPQRITTTIAAQPTSAAQRTLVAPPATQAVHVDEAPPATVASHITSPVKVPPKKSAAYMPRHRPSAQRSPAEEAAVAPEPATASVLDEVASLDHARHALADGSAAEALALLTQHEQRYASGTLAPEARVLRIRALLQLGRRTEAERLADEFLALHPHSPHAAQVRDLLSHH